MLFSQNEPIPPTTGSLFNATNSVPDPSLGNFLTRGSLESHAKASAEQVCIPAVDTAPG